MKSSNTTFTQHDKNHLLSTLKTAIQAAESMPVATPCATCVNYEGKICQLAHAAPPPEVLPVGCEAYVFDADSAPF